MRGLYARAWYYYAARGRPSPECGTTTDTANDPFATAPRRLSWPFGLQNSGCDRYRQQFRFPGLFRHLLTIGLQARDVSLDGLDRALPALLDSPAARETAGKRAFRRRVTAARPPASITAGHRPAACTQIRSDPGLLLYFCGVPPSLRIAFTGRSGAPPAGR
jgi:hypothetical protein